MKITSQYNYIIHYHGEKMSRRVKISVQEQISAWRHGVTYRVLMDPGNINDMKVDLNSFK